MTMTCRARRGRSLVSGLWLIGDRAWVVRRGETEGGKSVSWSRYASPPRTTGIGNKVKHRTGSLSRPEWKKDKPVRRKDCLLPVPVPRLSQAKWQKLEGGHDKAIVPRRCVASQVQLLSHATPQQIPRLLDSPRPHAPSRKRRMMSSRN